MQMPNISVRLVVFWLFVYWYARGLASFTASQIPRRSHWREVTLHWTKIWFNEEQNKATHCFRTLPQIKCFFFFVCFWYIHSHGFFNVTVVFRSTKTRRGKMVGAYSQCALSHRGRHTAGVRRPHLRVLRTRMHSSMAVCLVTHNTGIARCPPDPFSWDARWSQFSALFMHGRRRREKMLGTPNIFCCTHFAESWYLWAYPFKFDEKHLRKWELETFFFFSLSPIFFIVALGCFVIDTGVRWLLVLSLRNQEMWILSQKAPHKWQV